MTTVNSVFAVICIAQVGLDMCGRCARRLTGYTGPLINHLYPGDPERATCGTNGKKFEPAPRLCMIPEEDHHDRIPELVEALEQAEWGQIPYHTGPSFGIDRVGLLFLARAATVVLTAEPHPFTPGRLCPGCRGNRLVDKIVGSVPGLRDGTRMPVVSDRKLLCSTCNGIGALPLERIQQ